ncbi:tetratricopeptide (TPR) repeat protein [Actinokineospora baliensis]|uniref:tetratricopeptide repeat protein n=1 Tax=Actinokineospora baliensis TaxID=547056 RepID=UPI00195BCB5D|nr:tetratricopeptide repeat protein [Actinokineospora baliensis]MBM7775060.1 tetratricopeptide (TPR) repeat protein [Actinokineospora baliensis]
MSIEPIGPAGAARPEPQHHARSRPTNQVPGTVLGTLIQADRVDTLLVSVSSPTPRMPPPRQILAPLRAVLAREDELRVLDELAGPAHRPKVVVVSGMSGVGKTAVATQWAWANRARFTGGQFFADLADHRGRGAVAAVDVLGGFLGALGLHEQLIPADLAGRAALLRSRTADAPVLVVLEDADQAAQVRPFVPASPGSVVLVTSRHRLSGLVVEGASSLPLRPLDPDGSSQVLLDRVPTDVRASVPRPEVDALIDLCGGLPLALRIAGARLAEVSRWPARGLREHLSDEQHRLRRLALGGHTVGHVFDTTVDNLRPPLRTLYRRLGLHPGPEFSVAAAATVSGLSETDTADALDHLFEANLVEGVRPDRFRFHDLVRLHAKAVATQDEPRAERDSILDRITSWYLAGASAADLAVAGTARWRSHGSPAPAWAGPAFTRATAVRWWDTERRNLLETVRLAEHRGDDNAVLALCEALWPYYQGWRHHADWIEAHLMGVRCALRLGDDIAETRMRNQLARAYLDQRQFDLADEQLDAALSSARRSAEPRAIAVVRESLGVGHRERGNWSRAEAEFAVSLRINEQIADERGIALQLYHLADVLVRAGEATRAIDLLTRAAHIAEALDDDMTTTRVDLVLGAAYQQLGQHASARPHLERAAATARERGQHAKEVEALRRLVAVLGEDAPAELTERLALLTSSAQPEPPACG